MKADVITSCCGSLFSSERVTGIGSEIASMPALPMMWVFYGAMFSTLAGGFFFYLKGMGGYLYAALLPFRRVESLQAMLNGFIRKLALASVFLYAAFTAMVTYEIVTSSFQEVTPAVIEALDHRT